MSAGPRRAGAPHRLVAIGVVTALLVLAGVGNAAIRARHRDAATVRRGPDAVVSLAARVSSTAWYCPGPLEIGAGAPGAALVLANASDRTVHGELLVAGVQAAPSSQAVSVAAGATVTYTLPSTGPARAAAATVLLDGSGVGVEEVAPPSPRTAGRAPLVAPCATHASGTTYLAAGGSRNADHLSLALYDPGATPAVADVSFATSAGPVAPPSFQGIGIGAGQLVVLDVSRALPGRAMIATTVQATGGELVAGGELAAARGHGVETALVAATPSPAPSWTFPPVPAGPGTAEAFAVYDPGARAAAVVLTTSGSGGPATASATVPAGGVVALATGAVNGAGALRGAQLVVRHGSGVVVARELVLQQALPAASADVAASAVKTVTVKGHTVHRRVAVVRVVHGGPSEPTLLPALPPGYAVGGAIARPTQLWMLPVGRADATTGEVVTVANPSTTNAVVHLSAFGAASPVALHLGAPLVVRAGGVATLALSGLVTPAGPVALRLSASAPVVAGALLYSAAAKSVGMTTILGLPIVGGPRAP